MSYCGTQRANLQPFWGMGSGRKRNGQREGEVTERLSLVRMHAAISVEEEAIFVQSYKSMSRARDLDREHILDARSPGDCRVQVWSQSSHFRARRSDFRDITNVPVSRDTTLTLTVSTPFLC